MLFPSYRQTLLLKYFDFQSKLLLNRFIIVYCTQIIFLSNNTYSLLVPESGFLLSFCKLLFNILFTENALYNLKHSIFTRLQN
jgi:hypothetical protein